MPETYYKNLVADILEQYPEGEAQNIARYLLEDLFQIPPSSIAKRVLSTEESIILAKAVEELKQGRPLQYITGIAHFYGYQFKVSPAVLIPRSETEELVALTLRLLQVSSVTAPRLLEVGTGSGCIPITIKKMAAEVEVVAIDKSIEALSIAQENASLLEVDIDWQEVDFTDKTSWSDLGEFDFLLSNPPYIPWKEKHLVGENVLGQEPDMALFVPDNDPLVFYRLLAEFGSLHLRVNGHLLVETNQYNAWQVAHLFEEFQYGGVQVLQDLMGNDRIVRAIKVK